MTFLDKKYQLDLSYLEGVSDTLEVILQGIHDLMKNSGTPPRTDEMLSILKGISVRAQNFSKESEKIVSKMMSDFKEKHEPQK